MPHTTLARRGEHEDVVKGSRFLGVAVPLADAGAIGKLEAELRERYPDASHHVAAVRCGDVQRFGDDGEPGGTAGRPILEVILRRDLDFVEVVVVRWFGGTKLGAGGLVRAYSAAAARALDAAGTRVVLERTELEIGVPFAELDTLLRRLDGVARLERRDPTFDADGARVRVTLPVRDLDGLERDLVDATRGAARILRVDDAADGDDGGAMKDR